MSRSRRDRSRSPTICSRPSTGIQVAHWDGFPPGVRKQILAWVDGAKRDATRAKRVEQTPSFAARTERANLGRSER
ncbi:MAG: YdeI/OmpD-associated family protein [Actinomycetota bacterium]|nr:YdeI/OmpD-associated family protein [Actinomycetota bacterium]